MASKDKYVRKDNPQAREYFSGYRQAKYEVLKLGLEAFQAKYHAEYMDANNTPHWRGMVDAVKHMKTRVKVLELNNE